jgi:3-oxoacyl-[acyl-carrier protein] reductase
VIVSSGSQLATGIASGLRGSGAAVAVLDTAEHALDPDTYGAAFEEMVGELGGLDGVVCAHLPSAAAVEVATVDIVDEQIQTVWEDSFSACLLTFQAAYRVFTAAGSGGRLVLVLPVFGLTGAPGYTAGSAAAEGLRILMKSAARQWRPEGVTANAVVVANHVALEGVPGFEFPLGDPIPASAPDPESDIANVVGFLCSEASGYVTGSTLFCEGGLWMSAP